MISSQAAHAAHPSVSDLLSDGGVSLLSSDILTGNLAYDDLAYGDYSVDLASGDALAYGSDDVLTGNDGGLACSDVPASIEALTLPVSLVLFLFSGRQISYHVASYQRMLFCLLLLDSLHLSSHT